MAGGVTFGVRSNGLEADEYVQLPRPRPRPCRSGAATGRVGGVVADADLVVAVVGGHEVDTAARSDRVISGAAEERLRGAPAGQRELPGPPEAVTSWEPISPTLI